MHKKEEANACINRRFDKIGLISSKIYYLKSESSHHINMVNYLSSNVITNKSFKFDCNHFRITQSKS